MRVFEGLRSLWVGAADDPKRSAPLRIPAMILISDRPGGDLP